MDIQLTEREREMLAAFAGKQYEGAPDNLCTRTPIHVVERVYKDFARDESGNEWLCEDADWKVFDSFDAMLEYLQDSKGKVLPSFEDVKYERINDIWIDSEHAYCEAYDITAYPGNIIYSTRPVAFFFIRDEAVRYKDGYQSHNCADCRIYTYGLGYNNDGDMPVFRALLMRLGEEVIKENNNTD